MTRDRVTTRVGRRLPAATRRPAAMVLLLLLLPFAAAAVAWGRGRDVALLLRHRRRSRLLRPWGPVTGLWRTLWGVAGELAAAWSPPSGLLRAEPDAVVGQDTLDRLRASTGPGRWVG